MPYRPKRWLPVQNKPVDQLCMQGLRYLAVLAIPIALGSIALSCVYAYIQAREYAYTTTDWQRCFIAPNTGAMGKPPKQTVVPDSQMFAGSVAALAGRNFVFMILSFKAAYMAIMDHDLLPYGVWVSFFALVGQTFYREGAPVQPEPKEMSATLVTLASYVRPDMYDGFPWSKGVCETAYSFNRAFMAIQFCKLALTFLVFLVAVFAASQSPRQFYPTLRGTSASLSLMAVTVFGYVLTLVAKETVAQDTLFVLRSQSLGSIWPFKKADMDILSGTMMLACGAVLIGVFHECTEKFKLSAAVCLLHVAMVMPILCGTFAAYGEVVFPYGKNGHSFSMWDREECMAFISLKNSNPNNLFLGFDAQLKSICGMAQLSLIGQFIIAVSLLFQTLVSVYVIWANRAFKRPLALTRCRTCADRREDEGSLLDLAYEPTLISDPHQGCTHGSFGHAMGHGHHHHHRPETIQEEDEPFFEPLLPDDTKYKSNGDMEIKEAEA